ncbi:diphthine synthase [Dictyocaulus viviparus]|uniref:GPI alpha-1,4-mannosyltransferase I, catalytic subunit n=1 Tax=Dictyocaulus viviparus TaxID=29172 RepID=A0A0D8Y548_DICVI|nr:diphthine synthase [Dictyocaulus viviparus]
MALVKGEGSHRWTRGKILFISLAARLTLVLYSNIHDYMFHVNFTDIDYSVYSDAARYVANGKSPFDRVTYRYTPALAWILLPNNSYKDFGKYHVIEVFSGSDFEVLLLFFADVSFLGKFLFCVFDIIVGWMYFKIMDYGSHKKEVSVTGSKNRVSKLQTKEVSEDQSSSWITQAVVVFWLANPLTAVISARGNADVLVCASVLYTLYLLMKKQWFVAALVHGLLAIHLKIYPVIYFPSIFLNLCHFTVRLGILTSLKLILSNWKGFTFLVVSIGSFSVIVTLFYWIYGNVFLEEFLLYHVKRRDIRHNFSPYFYLLYLIDEEQNLSKLVGFLAFLPQVYLILYFAFRYHDDLPFCWFLTTFAFVTFNKISLKEVLLLITLWFGSQGLWLLFAYLFEFHEILTGADVADVAMLVVGDPFGATTHTDLVLRAKQRAVPLYNFGETVSIVMWLDGWEPDSYYDKIASNLKKGFHTLCLLETVSIVMWLDGWEPDSYYDKIASNLKKGFHTLCLLDIKTKEQSIVNMMRGKKIFEPARYLTCSDAASQLLKIIERKRISGIEPAYTESSPCVGLARVGWDDQKIVFCTLEEMSQYDLGPPLHCMILPGNMHPLEIDMLNTFKTSYEID